MGWSIGYDDKWQRDIGYGVPAFCDHPNCMTHIDRGLSHVCCAQKPYGGDDGCGLYFCAKHQDLQGKCERCADDQAAFDPTPDHPTWMRWKLTDGSWSEWRGQNPHEVNKLRTALGEKDGR
jgi:hypothetical protein